MFSPQNISTINIPFLDPCDVWRKSVMFWQRKKGKTEERKREGKPAYENFYQTVHSVYSIYTMQNNKINLLRANINVLHELCFMIIFVCVQKRQIE